MHLSFPEVRFLLSPPRNYMVFAVFLDLRRARLQVSQTAYKERGRMNWTSEFILSPALWIHRKQSRHPEIVSANIPWQNLCHGGPLFLFTKAKPGQGSLWCRTSLLNLCCWTGARSLPAASILEYPSALEAWYLLSLPYHACLWAACPPFYPAEVFWGGLQRCSSMEGLFREEQQSAQTWGEG